MRYWDEDRLEWTPELHDFAAAWSRQPKWVVSRTLKSVGPNAIARDEARCVARGRQDENEIARPLDAPDHLVAIGAAGADITRRDPALEAVLLELLHDLFFRVPRS
jgi:hypothetical protein